MIRPVVALALLALGSAAAAAPLKPVGRWAIDPNAATCVIHRAYGKGRQPVRFELKSIPLMTAETGMVAYIYDNGRTSMRRSLPVQLAYGDTIETDALFLDMFMARNDRGLYRFNSILLGREHMDRAAEAGALNLKAADRMDLDLAMPDLKAGLGLLDECVARQVERWGMSRDEQAKLAKLPEPTQSWAEIVTPEDYPPLAVLTRSKGVASVRVTVAEDGTPGDCQPVETSSSTPLDEATCDVALRARFNPALDKTGKPMRSIAVVRIHWNLAT